MAGRFAVDYNDRTTLYRIRWYEDGDYGGYIGQSISDGAGSDAPLDRGDWEWWAASRACLNSTGWARDNLSIYWDSARLANAALKAVNLALEGERERPKWAAQALAAGWKAPKGWKP